MKSKLFKQGGYYYRSRSMIYSMILVLPLMLLYELLVLQINESQAIVVRNGADVVFKMFLDQLGIRGILAYSILLTAIALVILFVQAKSHGGIHLRIQYFGFMIIEAAFYGAFLGIITSFLTRTILFATPAANTPAIHIMVSLGAGVYEELVFRVLLMTGTAATLQKLLGFKQPQSYVAAAIFSSFLFSIFHYIGQEAFALESFVFRFIAGMLFCILYIIRGFGITAYTHTLYDLFLLL